MTDTPRGNSHPASNSSMTQGPSASSPMRTLPRPRTRTRVGPVTLERLDAGDLAALRVERVDRARKARIEGMNRPQDLQRQLRIGDGIADERSLVGAGLVFFVPGARVPGGRHHRLVVGDLAVLDDDPVRERAARRA